MASRNRSRDARGIRAADREPEAHAPDDVLVRIHDPGGRLLGTGFVADHHGTVITSHEAVHGLTRLMVRTARGGVREVSADEVMPLPHRDLALVRTKGLGVPPLPVTVRERIEPGTYVRIAAGGWREARILGTTEVTYAAADRRRPLGPALELAVGTAGRDALAPGGGAAGGPVVDAATGAVVGVLGTALRAGRREAGFAVPLLARTPGDTAAGHRADGPLADLLAENAATVPAHGADLNPAGVVELTATSVGQDSPPGPLGAGAPAAEPVARAAVLRELTAFLDGPAPVLGLVGAPGSGRTTALAALAARRAPNAAPVPALWLRGADLRETDASVADAARRALARAARIVGASERPFPGGPQDATPERLARVARAAGCPLLLLLDGPEEMPPLPAPRLSEWAEGTARWLRETGARLVVACGVEYWERAGAEFGRGTLYGGRGGAEPEGGIGGVPAPTSGAGAGGGGRPDADGGDGGGGERSSAAGGEGPPETVDAGGQRRPPAVAGGARAAHEGGARAVTAALPPWVALRALPPCVPLGDLTEEEARQARARYGVPEDALPEADARHPLTLRLLSEVCAALPGAPDPARVDRDEVFAAYLDLVCLRIAVRLAAHNGLRGTAVRRLAARVAGQVHEAARRSLAAGQGALDRTGFEAVFPWGQAPARLGGGTGWATAVLAEGLLVPAGNGYRFAHEELADWLQGIHLDLDEALGALVHTGARPVPVPHHRIGPVVQAMLHLARHPGSRHLAARLGELVHALEADPHSWWAARLLGEVLPRVPDASPYTEVLRLLADRIAAWRGAGRPVPRELGPDFWTALALPREICADLLRRLILADGPPHRPGPRYLDTAARLLDDDPATVQPLLVRWFDDERPLPGAPHATVATAAQALLHTRRRLAPDALVEVLADSTHRRSGELLTVLAEEEPSAVCRAVGRWAHDARPARRMAAVTYGLRAAPYVHSAADRDLLRQAALRLLGDPGEAAPHGGALALLVQDPAVRGRYLDPALRLFAAGDPCLPPRAMAAALPTHPEPVLNAFRARLAGPDAGEALRRLADAARPGLVGRIAAVIGEAVTERPGILRHLAAYVAQRLDREETGQATAARAALPPLVTALLDSGSEPVRAALATVLGGAGTSASRPLRGELLEFLLARERDPAVLDALLRAAARRDGDDLRGLLHRTAFLLVRTPDGAARFDRALVDLGRHVPGFAARVTGWLAEVPGEWAVLVGPGTRRTLEDLADAPLPA
ncbi:large Pro/Ala/Gly-rich protein [Streptomyces cyaneogriseus subsp. noncyanogenus]|uniref:Large Pro/Ala/Gly-rich protein n=1 Tax=Streptomyces cyaneogriseus subsp. noncyanogenus TaxID=477245 RepID=A0A0C5FVN5_9ACTN|nr:trypsin-like peptidase domain-containing protein [Streptomyces cyaneogriseus]AJP04097.1 large Pro/Ala/Gly-rich protein [Streptomyces cyaneogriseus subsp. noncyanogenus]